MASMEDFIGLAGVAGASATSLLAVLSFLEIEFSTTVLEGFCRSVLLLLLGLVCLQGETRFSYRHQDLIQDNFGFALHPLGRGVAYLFVGVYCIGVRVAASTQASSSFFGIIWYVSSLIMMLGGIASLLAWREQRRSAAVLGNASDLDAYYLSS